MLNNDNEQQSDGSGSFSLGFGLGAMAGVAFTHFLHTKEGARLKEEFGADLEEVKKKLYQEGLLPRREMSAVDIVVHMVSHMSNYIEHAVEDTAKSSKASPKKNKSTDKKIIARAEKTIKKKPKKFLGF
jgi:hypothetical protein